MYFLRHLTPVAPVIAAPELPGLTEAVESQNWEEAQRQAEILGKAIDTNTALLQQMEKELEQ